MSAVNENNKLFYTLLSDSPERSHPEHKLLRVLLTECVGGSLAKRKTNLWKTIGGKTLRQELEEAMCGLSQRGSSVLKHRFGFDSPTGESATLQEVGDILHITMERVRQVESMALRSLLDLFNPLRWVLIPYDRLAFVRRGSIAAVLNAGEWAVQVEPEARGSDKPRVSVAQFYSIIASFDVSDYRRGDPLSVKLARANLAAAAPDMYALLRGAVEQLVEEGSDTLLLRVPRDKYYAALVKASGEVDQYRSVLGMKPPPPARVYKRRRERARRPHTCDICGLSLLGRSRKGDHILKEHPEYSIIRDWVMDKYLYRCGFCGVDCNGPAGAVKHVRAKHPELLPVIEEAGRGGAGSETANNEKEEPR